MDRDPAAPARDANRWAFALAVLWLLALGCVGVVIYYLIGRAGLIPPGDAEFVRAGLILLLGILGVVVVGRVVFRLAHRFAGRRRASLITDVYRIVAYALLAALVLFGLGVSGYALLAGGTFAGLVIGLASQTALANFVAGVVLLMARPFEPGDRLTLTTSQYNVLLPVYPPKFFSQDLLVPGFTGTVQDVGLMYTVLRLDDGPTASFPNSVVILGAVISHNLSERWVRVKYELPNSVDPTTAIDAIREAVRADDWVVGKRSVRVLINQATLTSFVISVDALCSGNLEEPPRSALFLRILGAVAPLLPPRAPASGTGTAPPAPPSPAQGPPVGPAVTPPGGRL
jgi:small conductance mechanosensitive channel